MVGGIRLLPRLRSGSASSLSQFNSFPALSYLASHSQFEEGSVFYLYFTFIVGHGVN